VPMSDDPIRLSWDEVNSSRTDPAVHREEMLQRAREHSQAQAPPPSQPTGATAPDNGIWYNAVVYTAFFGLAGGIAAWLASEAVNLLFEPLLLGPARAFRGAVFLVFLVSSMATPLALMLSIADHAVSRNARAVLINGSLGVVFGSISGAVVAFLIVPLFSALEGVGSSGSAGQLMAQMILWAVVGMFLAIAPGLTLRNRNRLIIGLFGGLLGGAIGGLIQAVLPFSSFSRLVAITAIGLTAGGAIGWIETVTKTGWLRVTQGLIAGKQFIIYRNPTLIGSSPQCEIYLFKDARVGPQHAALHTVPGGFELEAYQAPSGTFVNGQSIARHRLKNNDQIRIGSTTLLFQEKVSKAR
jgi:hypothetical protein